jgi:hypothetical protein
MLESVVLKEVTDLTICIDSLTIDDDVEELVDVKLLSDEYLDPILVIDRILLHESTIMACRK